MKFNKLLRALPVAWRSTQVRPSRFRIPVQARWIFKAHDSQQGWKKSRCLHGFLMLSPALMSRDKLVPSQGLLIIGATAGSTHHRSWDTKTYPQKLAGLSLFFLERRTPPWNPNEAFQIVKFPLGSRLKLLSTNNPLQNQKKALGKHCFWLIYIAQFISNKVLNWWNKFFRGTLGERTARMSDCTCIQ